VLRSGDSFALDTFCPGEALLVAFVFVVLPYKIIRSVIVWVPWRGGA